MIPDTAILINQFRRWFLERILFEVEMKNDKCTKINVTDTEPIFNTSKPGFKHF